MMAKNNSTTLAAIGAVTIVALTALIINSGGRFDSNWSQDGGSITIEGRPTPTKTNDCRPSVESSQNSDCNGN